MKRLIVFTDDDGFFGNDDTSIVDKEQSLISFQLAVLAQTRKIYPETELGIEFKHELHTYAFEFCASDETELCDENEVKSILNDIIDRVYNDGMFWVYKSDNLCRTDEGYADGGEPYTDEESEIINMQCPMCNGSSNYLGTLGKLMYFRCEDCGWEFYVEE